MRQTIRAYGLGRHIHEKPYAALVLSGEYEEAGDQGRFRVKPGHVIFHDRFDGHLNRFSNVRVEVLNLQLPCDRPFSPGLAMVADADSVAHVAETNRNSAVELLLLAAVREKPSPADWPDELASALMKNTSLKISRWGEENGIAPWVVSRGFALVFGISPEAFRARTRARQALKFIHDSHAPLVTIASHLGFADQSHMTRSIKQLTGMAPLAWRPAANGFKTAIDLHA